jgi:hypothetical protein
MKEQVSIDRICDCGKKLTTEEIEYYGYSCDECEKKALDCEDASALPDITGYMVIPPEEYKRLKRLDENRKKALSEIKASYTYGRGGKFSAEKERLIELLESLDK